MIKRKIDDLGRLVIPAEMRKEIGLKNNSEVDMELEDNKIILTNPKGMKSRKEIEDKIKRIYEADDLNNMMKNAYLYALKWVLNEED